MFTTATGLASRGRDIMTGIEVEIGCTFEFATARPTHAIVMVEPHFTEAGHIVETRFLIDPLSDSSMYHDPFGNSCRRVDLAAGQVTLTFDALVNLSDVADPEEWDAQEVGPAELPDDALMFVLPSRYCESDLLVGEAFERFGAVPPGWGRVQAISDWVHESMRFQYGASSPTLSARGVFESRVGVCRDFTHLGIAMCRALNIPARYVFGYLPDIGVPDPGTPMDFCAWMEVYLGNSWHTFDPRNNQRRVGRTVIGRGRDAADVAMVTSFGEVQLSSMLVVAREAGER
ncbi:MAG: transglutaminase domain protein [Ilumatobacteraceae bacterium]|nr:transglutaminase domain protein [Ilumatobacteraceae bacterium]